MNGSPCQFGVMSYASLRQFFGRGFKHMGGGKVVS